MSEKKSTPSETSTKTKRKTRATKGLIGRDLFSLFFKYPLQEIALIENHHISLVLQKEKLISAAEDGFFLKNTLTPKSLRPFCQNTDTASYCQQLANTPLAEIPLLQWVAVKDTQVRLKSESLPLSQFMLRFHSLQRLARSDFGLLMGHLSSAVLCYDCHLTPLYLNLAASRLLHRAYSFSNKNNLEEEMAKALALLPAFDDDRQLSHVLQNKQKTTNDASPMVMLSSPTKTTMRFFAATVLLQYLDPSDLTRFKSQTTLRKNKKPSLSHNGDSDGNTQVFSIVLPTEQLAQSKTNATKKNTTTKTLVLRRVSIDEHLLWLCQITQITQIT